MSSPSSAIIDQLCEKVGKRWSSIDAARVAADRQRENLSALLGTFRLIPSDTSFVVFGSLARREWTVNSDVDWTLLVDGQADPNHLKVAQAIRKRFVEAKFAEPGPTETFGGLAFSHELIHQIGGDDDSNQNTTRRILLLLESSPVGNAEAYDRIIGSVLNRYLDSDVTFVSKVGHNYKVPRFLLNDIVRFWRTMCVDYANKHRERQGDKWALRNAKLRLSRKLIFASGLLTCFNCHLKPRSGWNGLFDMPDQLEPLLIQLRAHVRLSPLEIVADAAQSFASSLTCSKIFDAYDRFLSIMNDGEKRSQLGALKATEAHTDPVFDEVRELSRDFQEGLLRLFNDENEQLKLLTREYGLF